MAGGSSRALQPSKATESTDEEDTDESSSEDGAAVDIDDTFEISHSHRAQVVKTTTKEAISEGSEKSGRFTANIQALIITSFLFALITALQTWAAKAANSQALLMDCVSMGVDALTYMGNIFVECKKRDGGDHVRSQLVCCFISLSILIYFTYQVAVESFETVQICRKNESTEPDDVDGRITLVFAVGGVVFDLISMWAFYRSHKKTGSAAHLNMFTALLHVGADFLRSTSTMVMSLLILAGGFDSTCLDAYTSLLIGASIICGALVGVHSWIKLFRSYYCP